MPRDSRSPSPHRGRSPMRGRSPRGRSPGRNERRPFGKKPIHRDREEQISVYVRNLTRNTK